jgi:flagellar assembly factor FliW
MNNNENQVEVVSEAKSVSQLMIEQMKKLSSASKLDLKNEIDRSTAMAKAGAVIINAEKEMREQLKAHKLSLGSKNQNQLGNG